MNVLVPLAWIYNYQSFNTWILKGPGGVILFLKLMRGNYKEINDLEFHSK